MKGKEVDVLEQLRKDPDGTLVFLYREHREEFISWASKNFGVDEDGASDCFQDAMIVLYKNVRERRLTDLSSTIKTYLFSIGKNMLLSKFKADRRMVALNEDNPAKMPAEHFEMPELFEGNTLENKIADIVQQINDPCKSILRYFYFRGFSMEEIAEQMNYKNAQTVKSQKVRCIKELQRLLQNVNTD